jgi:hypothetical protein
VNQWQKAKAFCFLGTEEGLSNFISVKKEAFPPGRGRTKWRMGFGFSLRNLPEARCDYYLCRFIGY